MAVAFSVRVDGVEALQERLRRIDPSRNSDWVKRALVDAALEVQASAATDQIVRGGSGPPLPDRLTSRTGTLRRSIRVNRRGVPLYIDVGTDLVYGALHELGGRVRKTSSRGKSFSAFYPKRPFLAPALVATRPKIAGIFLRRWREEIR